MLSSVQLLRELRNIDQYAGEREIYKMSISATKKNQFGEEILMLYKLSKYIISKHQTLFLDSEMSKYCGTSSLNLQVKYIDKFITKFIDKNKYYFHDQSSILIPEGSKRNHFNQIKNFFSKILCLPLFKKLK